MNKDSQAARYSDVDDHQEMPTQQQRTSYAQQRHSSSNAFAKISAVAADQQRASVVGQATISIIPKDEQLGENTRRKSANMVVTNVMRISGSELGDNQNEKTQDASRHSITRKVASDQKRVIVKEALKDEQTMTDDSFIKIRQRISRLILEQPDSDFLISGSRMTSEHRVSSSDANVKNLPVDHGIGGIKLTSLEAATFRYVLQECLECLSVLRYVIPAEVDERWEENYKTISQLYGVPDEPRMIFREDAGLLPLIPSVPAKIQRDRTYLYNVLKQTMCDIRDEKTFESLELEIDNIIKAQDGEHELQINCELWTEQAKQLKELIEFDELEFQENRMKTIDLAQQINADVDNSIFLNSSQLGYTERWEDAQVERQKLKLEQKEAELLSIKSNCQKLEEADQIVSGEVKTYLEANTREMEDEIISWTSQYIEELERRQQEMSELKDHIEGQLVEVQELTLLRDSRQAFIDEILAEKERIKREEEYWREIHRVATIIQAQWRGYMVRKQIGPYKGLWAQLKKRKAAARKKKKTGRSNKRTLTAKKKNK